MQKKRERTVVKTKEVDQITEMDLRRGDEEI